MPNEVDAGQHLAQITLNTVAHGAVALHVAIEESSVTRLTPFVIGVGKANEIVCIRRHRIKVRKTRRPAKERVRRHPTNSKMISAQIRDCLQYSMKMSLAQQVVLSNHHSPSRAYGA